MKVLWLFPPMGEGFPNVSQYRFYKRMPIRASIIYPYLAASGCTQIQKAGHEIVFMDCPTMNKTWKDVGSEIYDSDLVILEGRTPIIREIWKAIKEIKEMNPFLKIAVYGDHVSWNPMETLYEGADYVIQGGDFDYGARVLIDQLNNDSRARNHRILDAGLVKKLDSLPWVNRELVDWRNYFESWKTRDAFLWNMSMRGCYYHCVYCAWAGTLWDYQLRRRSPQKVFEETRQLHKKYGDLEILDDADLFDFDWGFEFARIMQQNGYGRKQVLWSCQTHPSMIKNPEKLQFMRKAGLFVVKLGVESGCDRSLEIMRKGSSRKMIEKAIKLLQEAEIIVHANMMIGFPWEGKADVLEWLSWIKKLDPNQAQFSLVIPYPNTELWEMAEENDWFIQDKRKWELYDASFPMMKMSGLSGKEVVDLYKKCWSSFYLNPKYVWRHIKTVKHWNGVKQLYHGFKSVVFGHMKAVDEDRRE